MKRLWSFARASVATLALLIIAVGAAPAEEYPSRIVTLIVPYPAGGVVDVVARRVADKLGNAMGKSVIVDNRSGAGGTVGATFVARAKPDGYTLLMGGASTHVFAQSSYPNLAYDPVESFIPITQITSGPLVLVIKSSFPASNLQDFLAYLRAMGVELFRTYRWSS
jgi:tripartite-type tricarboxylate transporter receptor subunit TctC